MTLIRLDLRHHCIETEISHQYNRRLAHLLGSSCADQELENQLVILLRALETLDFGCLRSRYAVLSGGHDANVRLEAGISGTVVLYLDDEIVKTRNTESSMRG